MSSEHPKTKFSYMVWMSLYGHGRGGPRCPTCGKFRPESDFDGAAHCYNAPGIHLDFPPSCKSCRGVDTPAAKGGEAE